MNSIISPNPWLEPIIILIMIIQSALSGGGRTGANAGPPPTATTWHIRLDGGTATQCDGKVNAAYPGSGSGLHCAYNHPYWMMTFSGGWAAAVAGDTIEFDDPPTNTTPYYLGETMGGLGFDWQPFLSGICPHANVHDTGGTCALPNLLDHMTIIGQNAGNCHQSDHSALNHPTILSGINAIFFGLSVQGTNGVTINCIAITQPDTCTSQGSGFGGANCGSTSNYIQAAGINFAYNPGGGIFPSGPANLTLTDVGVYGVAGSGTFGSHFASGTINVTDLNLIGNGGWGWNGDGGGCNNNCESLGTVNISNSHFDWNGCLAVKPYNVNLSAEANTNGFNYCFGQNTTGNGDGFVQIAVGANFTLNVDHSSFRWNTQDGFDGAHISDDPTTNSITNLSTVWAEGNAGQQIKIGAGLTSSAINSVMINNCKILSDSTAFPNNPTGWITLDAGDDCRAGGDGWNITNGLATTVTFENNTSVGYGNVTWDFTCSGFVANCNSATIIFKNNLNKGYPDPSSGTLATGMFLNTGISSSNVVSPSNNLWDTMHRGCPDPAISETNTQCGDPLLVAESNINAINPNLTASSPAIANGIHIAGITTDYNGTVRPNPPAIGAFEH